MLFKQGSFGVAWFLFVAKSDKNIGYQVTNHPGYPDPQIEIPKTQEALAV